MPAALRDKRTLHDGQHHATTGPFNWHSRLCRGLRPASSCGSRGRPASHDGRHLRSPGDVAELLHRGEQLEQQHRWGEALAHYEAAVRQYPKQSSLHQRFDAARLHYDLERRYADKSFCDSVARMSPDRALDLYGQVLLKIETHYVEAPNWKDLVGHGTANFLMALGEPTFVDRNVPQRNRLALDAFRRELPDVMASRPMNNRD